jgi:RNA polymerase sigma factor (sigma-70 family)
MSNTPKNLLDYIRVIVGVCRDDYRDDTQLLAQFVEARDERAFATLLVRHGALVWRTCKRVLGDGPESEDAFQATFLALARKAGKLRGATLTGWLHRVARDAALKADNGMRRRRSLEQRLRTVKQPAVEGENADRTELYTALDEELAGLPEKLRVSLLLRYLEGKSQDEVAHILGCSRFVVRKRLARGEAILRKRLERRGLTVEIGPVAALLGGSTTASEVPSRLIGTTVRAAVAFRSGIIAGGPAKVAQGLLGSFPTPLAGTIMRKSLWIMLAVVCSLGVGLAAWQASSARPDEVGSPKAVAEPDSGRVDRQGDPLPDGALARLGSLHLRHVGKLPLDNANILNLTAYIYFHIDVKSVIFSRDGKMLITMGDGNPIQLWNAATGKLLRSFDYGRQQDGRVKSAGVIALSPDGKTLAAPDASGRAISLREAATGKLLRSCSYETSQSHRALAFSQDGRTLLSFSSGFRSHGFRVWEVATGKEVRHQPLFWKNAQESLKESQRLSDIKSAVFSSDGRTLAAILYKVGTRNTSVDLWEVATGKLLRHLDVSGHVPPGAVAFSPDNRFLAISNTSTIMGLQDQKGGAVHLWEMATGKEVRTWTPDPTETYALAFSPDGKLLATGSGFGPIRLWETATGKELRQCQDYQAHVVALAFSPDSGTLASLSGIHDYTARLWEVASGKERVPLTEGHMGPVVSVAFSPDGKSLISGGRDGLVGLWNTETGQEQHPLLRAGDFQALAVVSPDGQTVLSVGNSFSPKNYENMNEAVFWGPPTQICVWDGATGQKLRQFEGPSGAVQSLALSPDGKILALAFPRRTCLLEVATGKMMGGEIASYPGAPGGACAIFSPDGKTLAVKLYESEGSHSIVQFQTLETRENFGSFKALGVKTEGGFISSLAYSPDGQTLAVGGQDRLPPDESSSTGIKWTIRLWRLQGDKKGWKEAGTLIGHVDHICGLAFSSDGKSLASASPDGTLRLWEVATGKERRCIVGHRGDVWCLAFAPDGRRLAAGGSDPTILIWDVTGRLHGGQLRPAKLSAQEVRSLWADLANVDAARAARAVWTLASAPAQALPLLQQQLRPTAPVGPGIDRLIVDLDSDTFAVRQKAMDELAKLGEAAAPALRQALAKSTVEMRRRLEQLLESLGAGDTFPLSGEKLRSHRALEVLGQLDTLEATQLLEALARGAPGTRQTLEAQAALKGQSSRMNATKP